MQLSTPVLEVVGRDVVSVDVNQSILDAIRILSQGRFHHLPVVDGKRLAGMLSTADILKLNGEALAGKHSQAPALLASRARVGDIMVAEVIAVSARATVAEAAQLLSSGEYHALPIMAATGELVGIVTTTDLINFLLDDSSAPQATDEVRARMQLLEQVYDAAKEFFDSGASAPSRDALEQAVYAARWAA